MHVLSRDEYNNNANDDRVTTHTVNSYMTLFSVFFYT